MKLRPATLVIALLLLSPLGVPMALAEDKLRAEELAEQLNLSEEAIERVRRGEVVAEALEASSDKDLSLAVIMRLDAPLGTASRFIDADRLREFQMVILSSGEIDPVNPSLPTLSLPAEVRKEFVEDPAGTFSMSSEEAAEVVAAAREGDDAAIDAYRSVLARRAKAYWENGLAGITPYAGENRSPAVDLAHANAAIRPLIQSPLLRSQLEVVPAQSKGRVIHELSWAIEKGRDQPSPVLIHRIFYREPDAEVVVERRFYSGCEYDALQIVVGILPTHSDWSAVFYTNHTYTAQVTGFGGSAKRSIGRKLLEKELVAEMQRAQKAIPPRPAEAPQAP